jgi:putative heme-binding domain-containing protein
LRDTEVAFSRLGRPSAEVAQKVVSHLNPLYPASVETLNRELCELLIYLEAPGVVKKTLGLLAKAPTQEEQIHYVFHLRNLSNGWTMEDRREYLAWFERNGAPKKMGKGAYPGGKGAYESDPKKHPPEVLQWFADVDRPYGDGASFPKFIINIRESIAASFSDTERAEFASFIAETKRLKTPATSVVARKFVKEWTMDDLLPSLDQAGSGRSFAKGKEAFLAAQCLACHRFGNEGGSVGPDITAVSSRFSRADILSSIVEPSKVISDQYQNITVKLKNGDDFNGRLLDETADKLVLMVDPLSNVQRTVKRSDVQSREPSKVSPMPDGLVSILTKEEILDLIAYLESGGNKSAAAFTQK